MPSDPVSILPAASGDAPASPPSVLAVASASPPSSPEEILAVASGSPPSSPPSVLAVASASPPDDPEEVLSVASSSPPSAPPAVLAVASTNPPEAPEEILTEFSAVGVGTAASLVVNPTGADNSFLLTALVTGMSGNDISIELDTPAAQANTGISVDVTDILVTPGTKARMVVAGTLSPDVTGTYHYAGRDSAGFPFYTTDGSATPASTGVWAKLLFSDQWRIYVWDDGVWDDSSDWYGPYDGTGGPPFPDTDSWSGFGDPDPWTASNLFTGTPTVTAAISSAQQVIDEINDAPEYYTVAGTLAKAGNPVVFPALLHTGTTDGRKAYKDTPGEEDGDYFLYWSSATSKWNLIDTTISGAAWSSTEDVETPDLVATWSPSSGGLTGTPTLTLWPAASTLVTAAASGTVTGAVAAVAAANLTGGAGVASPESVLP